MNTQNFQINIDNYSDMFKSSILPCSEDFQKISYGNDIFKPYETPLSFVNSIIKEWNIIAIVTDCNNKDYITVSTIDPDSEEPIYKIIPKNKIDFSCSENDYILINIKQFSDYPEPYFEYNISQYKPSQKHEEKQQIINNIQKRINEKNII